MTCSPTLSWIPTFAFGLNTLYLQIELNKVVDRYPGALPETPVPCTCDLGPSGTPFGSVLPDR
ncbi:hypothetical protein [Rhodococcus sp. ARC_M6]|uniref:hypothetical protein n=1 Tax=Rhodococcus sp. ARC_M6 TaxID=2928852 RepID=UPI001FB49F4B|nr:hypothetical protein [Rhodococcus sp. ARC_M6]MCJ0904943.1 hypothetical protein [Rhodococcus sp. ARC_M6]